VPCIDPTHLKRRRAAQTAPRQRVLTLGLLFATTMLAACNVMQVNRQPAAAPVPAPVVTQVPAPVATPAPAPAPAPAPVAAPTPSARPSLPLAANWHAYRERAAQMIMKANPQATFAGPLPNPLASIPVLQVQLNADGSVLNIEVLRTPKFEPQTIEMAKVAIARAAPFGPVGNLPKPWQFNETFLYNDALKFQLDSLVDGK
jgi:hypothetical protein